MQPILIHHSMKRVITVFVFSLVCAAWLYAGTNIQVYYDFGSLNTACANRRSPRVTTTLELFYPDKWGNTFAFIDFDYTIHPTDPHNTPFMAYGEIARCLNFWQNSVVKDLSLQVEYNGGLGIYKDATTKNIHGYGINHAALVGLNYCLHTADYKNIFNIEILFKYIVDDNNMWRVKDDSGNWHKQRGNTIPLQFTFVWGCDDFCTLPGLRFSGFLDIWGAKQSVLDRGTGAWTDPAKQSFVFISEPQLWYNVGRWFKCPNLNIGTEIEFSYNFTGAGFMCNPCLGIKWCFD